jgi:hypothetical protein
LEVGKPAAKSTTIDGLACKILTQNQYQDLSNCRFCTESAIKNSSRRPFAPEAIVNSSIREVEAARGSFEGAFRAWARVLSVRLSRDRAVSQISPVATS